MPSVYSTQGGIHPASEHSPEFPGLCSHQSQRASATSATHRWRPSHAKFAISWLTTRQSSMDACGRMAADVKHPRSNAKCIVVALQQGFSHATYKPRNLAARGTTNTLQHARSAITHLASLPFLSGCQRDPQQDPQRVSSKHDDNCRVPCKQLYGARTPLCWHPPCQLTLSPSTKTIRALMTTTSKINPLVASHAALRENRRPFWHILRTDDGSWMHGG